MVAQERLNLYRTGPCQQLPEALVSRDGGEKDVGGHWSARR